MRNTSLPNSIIKTVTELYLLSLDNQSLAGKDTMSFLKKLYPGCWMLEKTSFNQRRRECGSFDSIVRLICFYKQTPKSLIKFCTENSEGEFILWENCSFLPLLPYNYRFDDTKKEEIIAHNLAWAREAAERHELAKDLEGEEQLLFEPILTNSY